MVTFRATFRIYVTVAILSFVVILLELLQTRILSFVFHNYVVYLTVSIALLGFGISGTLVAITAARLSNCENLVGKLLLLAGASVWLGLIGVTLLSAANEVPSILRLAGCYFVHVLPFVFAGSIISILFATANCSVGRLYAIDLLSAGVSCIFFFFLLPLLGAYKLLGCAVALCSGLSYLWTNKQNRSTRLLAALLAGSSIFLLLFPVDQWFPLHTEPYKRFAQIMNIPGARIERTVWTPMSRIDVLGTDRKNLPYFFVNFFRPNLLKFITQDGSAYTPMLSYPAILEIWDKIQAGEVPYSSSLVYLIKHNPRVAIIGLGGGYDVIMALGYGAKDIYGAELNPAIFRFITHDYVDYQGRVFENSRLHLYNEEGRSMLRKLDHKVDVLHIECVDTGAALYNDSYVLSENYLYTVEAFKEFLSHLQPGGILSIRRAGGIEGMRLTALACQALREMGCSSINKQLMVFALDRGTRSSWYGLARKDEAIYREVQLLVKNQPFTDAEVQSLVRAAQASPQLKCNVLFYPALSPALAFSPVPPLPQSGGQSHFKPIPYEPEPEDSLTRHCTTADLICAFKNGTENEFFARFPYRITPTRDDSPFFFQSDRKWGYPQLPNPSFAMDTLVAAIVQSTFFMAAAIFLPLWKFSREGIAVPHAASLSVYFASLGFAFMLFELGLTQKCVLFLGNPLYSLSVVLATLLLSAGLGSALVAKLEWDIRKVLQVFGVLFVLVALTLTFCLNSMIYALMHLPLPMRMLSCFCMLLPVGLIMGTFFPVGLQLVREESKRYLPWAWGINGCASVYGSFAAILFAIYFGFTNSLMIGIAIYVVAFFAGYRQQSKRSRFKAMQENCNAPCVSQHYQY